MLAQHAYPARRPAQAIRRESQRVTRATGRRPSIKPWRRPPLVCGALLCIGLLSRIAALPLIGTMVVAITTAQWQNVDSFGALYGLSEFLYIVIFAWIAASGPGPVALDSVIERSLQREPGGAAVSSVRSFA